MSAYDVYSFGVIAPSTLYVFDGSFPGPDGYAEITAVQDMVGGEAANASIVLARLGATVKLDGNWLGSDDRGRRTKTLLDEFGIDTSRLALKEDYRGVVEAVFASEGSRTIFGSYGSLLEREDWNTPAPEDVRQARVACIDPFFKTASVRAAEIASDADIPIVTVDCLLDDPLLEHASVIVVSNDYLRGNYSGHQHKELFDAYREATRGLVVFTFGEREVWYGRPGNRMTRRSAHTVNAVDTSAAGDAFRAGVAYGLLRGWDDAKTIDFAAATAAIVCTRYPGALNSPTYAEVSDFMGSVP